MRGARIDWICAPRGVSMFLLESMRLPIQSQVRVCVVRLVVVLFIWHLKSRRAREHIYTSTWARSAECRTALHCGVLHYDRTLPRKLPAMCPQGARTLPALRPQFAPQIACTNACVCIVPASMLALVLRQHFAGNCPRKSPCKSPAVRPQFTRNSPCSLPALCSTLPALCWNVQPRAAMYNTVPHFARVVCAGFASVVRCGCTFVLFASCVARTTACACMLLALARC